MIGGCDIRLEGAPSLDQVSEHIKVLWPNAIERGSGNEALFYRDAAALSDWVTHGAIKPNADTMIHVLWSSRPAPNDGVWIVVDNEDSDIAIHLMALEATR